MTPQSHLRSVDPPDNGDTAGSSRAQQRPHAKRALPTDRMKMDVQVRVLNAIGRLSGAGKRSVNAQELSKAMDGLAATTVMLSNRFFADAGWIRSERGQYTATDALVEYSRRRALAASGSVPREAMEALRASARQSWFWEALAPFLANGTLPYTEAAIILMSEAQASESHKPMIANLIAWLRYIGLVEQRDDHIVLADGESAPTTVDPVHAGAPADGQLASTRADGMPTAPETTPGPTAAGAMTDTAAVRAGTSPPAYVIAFNFGTQLTADDLARLSPEQIKALFEAVGTVMALTGKG